MYGPNASGLSDLTPFLKYGFFIDPTPTVLYSVIHVEDLTNAIVIAIQKAEVLNQTFFVADPNAYTWKQLIQAVANRNVRFLNINPRLAGAAIRLYQFFAKPLKGPALLNYDKINEMNENVREYKGLLLAFGIASFSSFSGIIIFFVPIYSAFECGEGCSKSCDCGFCKNNYKVSY